MCVNLGIFCVNLGRSDKFISIISKNMSSYENISRLINDLIEQSERNTRSDHNLSYLKPKLMKTLLEIDTFRDNTLTNVFRNNDQLRNRSKQRDFTSGYATVVGELLVNYFNDVLERDFFILTREEKTRLIEQINKKIGG